MEIGIIVYSQTGNTYSVAETIKEKLKNSDHQVNVERIVTVDNVKTGKKEIEFKTIPGVKQYEAIIFGSSVEAFSLNSVMKKYLNQIKSLKNKKIACYVTKGLPFNWTGGNRAIRQMEKICKSKNGVICGTDIIKWVGSGREKNVNDAVNNLSNSFIK